MILLFSSEARRPLNSSMKMEARKNQYVANKGEIPAGPYSPPSDPRVHGEDVPLVRGLVPPSAPNPTTDDAVATPDHDFMRCVGQLVDKTSCFNAVSLQ